MKGVSFLKMIELLGLFPSKTYKTTICHYTNTDHMYGSKFKYYTPRGTCHKVKDSNSLNTPTVLYPNWQHHNKWVKITWMTYYFQRDSKTCIQWTIILLGHRRGFANGGFGRKIGQIGCQSNSCQWVNWGFGVLLKGTSVVGTECGRDHIIQLHFLLLLRIEPATFW